MLIKILTFLTKMSKLLTIPRFYGPLATVAFTVAYHAIVDYFGLSISLGWLYFFMVAGSFIGGRRAGLVAAAWISLYAYYVMPPGDWIITAQRVITSFATAALVGWQTHRLRQFYARQDSLYNGNAAKLEEGLRALREAKGRLQEARTEVITAEDKLGNVLAGVVGYKGLRKLIDDVQAWHADPANMKKLQDMQEAEEAADVNRP